jgi:anti-sigma factor (TIGR02949 family)
MNIACNECRQRLSDALDETANPAAAGALAQHLAGCDACRAELELLQAARAELRTFPVLAAPTDLRARVRAQLEATPVVPEPLARPLAERKAIAAPASPPSVPAATPHKRGNELEPGTRRTWRSYLRVFSNNPAAVAWASCCMLLLIYSISLSRRSQSPGQYTIAERAPVSEPQQKHLEGTGKTPAQQPAPRNAPASKPIPKPTAPGTVPELAVPALPGVPPAVTTPPAGEKPNATPNPPVHEHDSAIQEKPQTQAPQTKPAPKSAPKPMLKSSSDSSSAFSANGSSSARTRAGHTAGAPAPAPQQAKKNFMARSTPDNARDEAGRAAITSAERAPARDETTAETTAVREITTRLTPPRNAGWAQVSVVLSGGARFDDGQKSRVIWSGSALANEPIELSFSVQGAAGGTAKISLQEVKNGQAQTITSKTVAVGASG